MDLPVLAKRYEAQEKEIIRIDKYYVAVGNDFLPADFTDDDVDRVYSDFYELICSADTPSYDDSYIRSIILECVDEYYNGVRSAEATADMLNMRVGVYLAEQG